MTKRATRFKPLRIFDPYTIVPPSPLLYLARRSSYSPYHNNRPFYLLDYHRGTCQYAHFPKDEGSSSS